MRKPTVSVGLPVHNGELYISEAIDSVLKQDFGDLELVISDNASCDATEEICRDYAYRDPRVSYSRLDENQGAARNYNRVFAMSRGTYFKWAAHDDVLRPQFLQRCIETFDAAERAGREIAIVHPRSLFIDEAGAVIGSDWDRMQATSRWPALRVFATLQSMNMAAAVFGLMPRELVSRTGLIRSFAASDYVFMLEAAMLGEIVQIEDVLFHRRVHPGMSREANKTKKEVLLWFDPTARSRLSMRQRLYLEYLKSTVSLRTLPPIDRGTCAVAAILSVIVKRFRVNAGWLRNRLLESMRR